MKILIWHSGVTLLSDTFTDVNATNLNAHTMNVGGGWTIANGSLQILGGGTYVAGNTAAVQNEAVADAKAVNYVITAVSFMSVSTSRMGLFARFGANDGDCWVVYFDTATAQIYIYQNFITQRASGALPFNASKFWNWRVILSGSTITATVTQADSPLNTQTLSYGSMSGGGSLTNTKCGINIFDNNATSYWDNFLVTQ